MRKIWAFIPLLLMIGACASNTTPKPTLPTLTPTIIPTITPTPAPAIISIDNISKLTEIDRWQTLTLSKITWNDEGTKVFISDFDNVLVYDVTQLQHKQISFDSYLKQEPHQNFLSIADQGNCDLTVDQFTENPDKTILATGWSYGHKQPPKTIISLWDVTNRKCLFRFPEFDGWLTALAFSPTGKFLISSTDTTRIWNVKKAEQTCKIVGREATFVPGKDLLAIVETRAWLDYQIGLWDIEKCEIIQKYKIGGLNPVFSPDGELLASNTGNHILIINAKTGELLKELDDHPQDVGTISFSPDGRFLLSGNYRESTNPGSMSTFILWGIKP
jgi:WD40 repeat protein